MTAQKNEMDTVLSPQIEGDALEGSGENSVLEPNPVTGNIPLTSETVSIQDAFVAPVATLDDDSVVPTTPSVEVNLGYVPAAKALVSGTVRLFDRAKDIVQNADGFAAVQTASSEFSPVRID